MNADMLVSRAVPHATSARMARPAAKPLLLTSALLGAMWLGIAGTYAQEPLGGPPPPGHPPPPPGAHPPPPGFLPPPRPPPPRPLETIAGSAPAPSAPSVRPDTELDAASAAVDSARRDSDSDALVSALTDLAALLDDRGRTRESLPLLQEAVGLADSAQDERQAQQVATLLAAAHGRLGDARQAVFWRQRADTYRERFTRRLLHSDVPDAATAAAPMPAVAPATVDPANEAVAGSTAASDETAGSGWLWLIALGCGVLLLAWWRSRQRAAELEHEAAQLQRRQQHAQSLNARLQAESEQLRRQAVQDTLTGALTRQAFAASLKDLLVHAGHYGRPVALLVMDLDHFKSINDQYGHLSGDAALKLVVGIAREHLGSGDLLGRFGGDEFLVAAIDYDAAAALALGEAIRKSVAQRAGATQALMKLRVSIGIAHATPASGYDLEPLFQRADAALYAAKRAGRDRVAIESDGDTAPIDQPSLRQLSATTAGGEAAGNLVT